MAFGGVSGCLRFALWVESSDNNSLAGSVNVLLYAPSDTSLQNAQQLATQLHTSSDAIVFPGGNFIPTGQDRHILVAYQANNAVAHRGCRPRKHERQRAKLHE
jgi:hypothetical protein